MGCNCKKLKKIEKKYPTIVNKSHNKNALSNSFNKLKQILWNFLGFLIVILFTTISIPLLFGLVILNYVKNGNFELYFPFLKKQAHKNKTY